MVYPRVWKMKCAGILRGISTCHIGASFGQDVVLIEIAKHPWFQIYWVRTAHPCPAVLTATLGTDEREDAGSGAGAATCTVTASHVAWICSARSWRCISRPILPFTPSSVICDAKR